MRSTAQKFGNGVALCCLAENKRSEKIHFWSYHFRGLVEVTVENGDTFSKITPPPLNMVCERKLLLVSERVPQEED